MAGKKIIIISLVLTALIIGSAVYYSYFGEPLSTPSPSPSQGSSPTESGIIIGNPSAPVTIDLYTNFLCSACARFALITYEQIRDAYIKTGQVKMNIFVFPPKELSVAALCAYEQNKFVEYHDYAFSHQSSITGEDALKNFAANAGLNENLFATCYASGKYDEKIQKWYSEGEARGVDATPTFFVNGQKLIGALPFADFKKVIDEKLK